MAFPYFAPRPRDDLLGCSVEHEGAFSHHQDATGDEFHIAHDMGGEDHDLVLRKAGDEVSKAYALFGIEARRRFIEHEYCRVVYHRLRYSQALLHAAGEGLHLALRVVAKADLFQKEHAALSPVAAVEAFKGRHVAHEVEGGEVRVASEVLRQIAEKGPVSVIQFRDIAAIE